MLPSRPVPVIRVSNHRVIYPLNQPHSASPRLIQQCPDFQIDGFNLFNVKACCRDTHVNALSGCGNQEAYRAARGGQTKSVWDKYTQRKQFLASEMYRKIPSFCVIRQKQHMWFGERDKDKFDFQERQSSPARVEKS